MVIWSDQSKLQASLICHHICVSRCVRGEQSDWSPVPGSSQWGLVPVAEPASLPASWGTAYTPQPQSDRSLPGNTHFYSRPKLHPAAGCWSVYTYMTPPPPFVSAGHVTHGWRSHPGNSQLQHWGFCWPRDVPTLLWITPITLPLRTELMFAFISCCSFFSMLLDHQVTAECSRVNVRVHLSFAHRQTHTVHQCLVLQLCSICKHTHTSLLQRGTLPLDGGNISQPIEKLYLPSHWGVCLTMKFSRVSIGTARGQAGDYSCAHLRYNFSALQI